MRGKTALLVSLFLMITLSGCSLREELVIDADARVQLANSGWHEVWAVVDGTMRKGRVWRPAGTLLVPPKGAD